MTDTQAADKGAKLKWGWEQRKNPTPKWATAANRWVIALVGFYGAIQFVVPDLFPPHWGEQLNKYILLVPALTTLVKNGTGWDFSDKPE